MTTRVLSTPSSGRVVKIAGLNPFSNFIKRITALEVHMYVEWAKDNIGFSNNFRTLQLHNYTEIYMNV